MPEEELEPGTAEPTPSPEAGAAETEPKDGELFAEPDTGQPAAEEPDSTQEEITPSWLDEPVQPTPPAQPTGMPPGAPTPQPQPQPTPPTQVPPPPGMDLNALIDNPAGAIDARVDQAVRPLVSTVEAMAGMLQNQVRSQLARADTGARDAIRTAYKEEFAKDRYFTGDPVVKAEAERIVQNYYAQAREHAARTGDASMFQQIADPTFARGVLAFARINTGRPLDAPGGGNVAPGAEVSPVLSREAKETAHLSADEKQVCRTYGISEEDYLKAKAENEKYEI